MINSCEAGKITELEKKIKEKYSNITGMVVMKNGETVYENYFNGCDASCRFHVFSVTKSIISILFGIAIEQGFIRSIEEKVLDFFPDYRIKRGEKTIQKITIRDMLTMTAPYKYKFAPYTKYFTSADWVQASLDLLGGRGQIGEFRYAPLIGPDILSGVLVKATEQSVLDFAKKNLFQPLDISVESNITFRDKEEQLAFYKEINVNGWVAGPAGVNTAGWGLSLTPVEMAKIGSLYLDNGMWNGKQLVPAGWVEDSTKEHARWKKLNLPYGYLWWIVDEKENACAAMGDGGNVIYFNREKKIVISIASLFKPRAADRVDFIKDIVEPIFT